MTLNPHILIIPGKPIAKKRPRFARIGKFVRTYNDQETEESKFLHHVADQWHDKVLVGALAVKVTFYLPRPKCHFGTGKNAEKLKASAPREHTKKPDLDNCVKFVKDCLNGVVWKDDAQVCHLEASKQYHENPMTVITVKEVTPCQDEPS